MTASKLVLSAASGVGGGGGLNVEEVFSTYLYEGNDGTQTITNGIDLSGEGGLVWIKPRDYAYSHYLYDSERSLTYNLYTNATNGNSTDANDSMDSFNSNGFTITGGANLNASWADYCSWTFRKAPKFFDVVTWSGDGVNGRTISHNLGSTPGMILVKRLDSADGWITYHRGMDASSPEDYAMFLNLTNARATETYWNNTAPTSTGFTVSSNVKLNGSSGTYVAYLFAHNDGDGDFGPDGDADIIKCGSFVGASSTEVDLGFEPQWLLVKASSLSQDWRIMDNMRGITDGEWVRLAPNDSSAEASFSGDYLKLTPTGFVASQFNTGQTFIYMAIRRGPMAVPESATDVFGMDTLGGTSPTPPAWNSGFPVDMGIYRLRTSTSNFIVNSRLNQGRRLMTNATDAESGESAAQFDYMNGYYDSSSVNSNYIDWMWRRAPNYFDVVAYTGTGSNRTVSHNLGVAPEMMWVKRRDAARQWGVYHKDIGNTKAIYLQDTGTPVTSSTFWNDTTPTESLFTVGTNNTTNASGGTYIAYLFASLDGISKVGSYTGNGGSQTIDCGFSAGARFVLIKCATVSSTSWLVFDTERGIVAGNDNALVLNSTQAEITTNDYIDPDNSGFAFDTSNALVNGNGNTYIFYAIA